MYRVAYSFMKTCKMNGAIPNQLLSYIVLYVSTLNSPTRLSTPDIQPLT